MTDLFTEAYEERAGIMQDAGLSKETAERMAMADTKANLHACEVRSVVRMCREKGKAFVVEFLAEVEKKRGKQAMEDLRNDALQLLKASQ